MADQSRSRTVSPPPMLPWLIIGTVLAIVVSVVAFGLYLVVETIRSADEQTRPRFGMLIMLFVVVRWCKIRFLCLLGIAGVAGLLYLGVVRLEAAPNFASGLFVLACLFTIHNFWLLYRRLGIVGASRAPGLFEFSLSTRTVKSLDLDAEQFAPLADEEARAGLRLFGSWWSSDSWFRREDQIPPADETRTLLVDRAMVGQGLLTPEELAEIHKVGQEMDRVRGELDEANQIADQAVAQYQQEHRRLKEEKRAEAAERRRQHAEAVAQRRQSDIIFLGRGVSKGLADRRANVERLQEAKLPVLATPADLAEAMGISIPRLRWLAFHKDSARRTHYVRFEVPKRSGGMRVLSAPHRDLGAAQHWVLREILDKVPTHDAAHGFTRQRSTLTNAQPHVGRAVVINADLQDFFPSITFPRVLGVFRSLGYSPAVSTILALLSTEAPRRTVTFAGTVFHVASGPRALPQGACTSPALSNLVTRKLDRRLSGLADRLDWTYTRYADDLTFSTGNAAAVAESHADQTGYLLARLRHIVADEGFCVNEKKTRVLRPNAAQTVTGIVVNRRPGVPRKLVRRLRAILHRARREGLEAQNRQRIPHFQAHLRGLIAYIAMVNPRQAYPLQQALEGLTTGD